MCGPRGRLEHVTDAADSPVNSDVPELSYEQARDELVRVVTALESGGATLEDSLALWERGNALADRCEEWLQGAKARLDAARTSASTASENPEGADRA
ncbi:Exodeoxyribonuclease VII small subunit [Agrococcus baldri]|uniref:Exodeoxyribonuclease 7 small subunit n=1 Tax=Agrococcus baldri TaxID=153730 RepID=A0AA94KYJ4_9MICO|nr:Exodeoxyribonuclease VII small subunit [Agrococcus baldri]